VCGGVSTLPTGLINKNYLKKNSMELVCFDEEEIRENDEK